jgi:hypothetical protein
MAGPDIPRIGFLGAGKIEQRPGARTARRKSGRNQPLAADNPCRDAGDCIQADTSIHIISDTRKIVAISELASAEPSMELGNVQPPQGNRE